MDNLYVPSVEITVSGPHFRGTEKKRLSFLHDVFLPDRIKKIHDITEAWQNTPQEHSLKESFPGVPEFLCLRIKKICTRIFYKRIAEPISNAILE
jgi:hypothetical protein